MGEAKRKRQFGLCRCGSLRAGGECCFRNGSWFKPPSTVDLIATGFSGSHPRCYLRHLNTCSDKVSREHTISAVVLRAMGSASLRVGGASWLADGEERAMGISGMVANCLCIAHKGALASLDAAGGQFYESLQQLSGLKKPTPSLLSGHDIERWMLKTAVALAASGQLCAVGQERLPGTFADGIDLAALLQVSIGVLIPTSGLRCRCATIPDFRPGRSRAGRKIRFRQRV